MLIAHAQHGTLSVQRWGTGALPIVLISGLGASASVWFERQPVDVLAWCMVSGPWGERPLLAPALAAFAPVVTYDRAGLGRSEAPLAARDLDDFLTELGAVLERVGATRAVLVGHSLGGLLAFAFARRWPARVAGLVLLDASHPDQVSRLLAGASRAERQADEAQRQEVRDHAPERPDLTALLSQGEGLLRPGVLGALPLSVVSRGVPLTLEQARGSYPDLTQARLDARTAVWQALQAEYLTTSSRSRQVIARHSGHHVHFDEPVLVVDEVRRVWLAAGGRSGSGAGPERQHSTGGLR